MTQVIRPHVRVRGRGPRLYAHPGGPGLSSREFVPDLAGLERVFEIAYVDPRGTGATERPADPHAYALADYVADLAALIDEPAFVLGFSHGGLVAQAFAARHPRKVRGLVLASTAPRFAAEDVEAGLARKIAASEGEPWLADALAALQEEQAGAYGDDADLGRIIAREMPLYFHRYDERARRWAQRSAERCNGDALRHFNATEFATVDLRGESRSITARTIVVSGADDFVCPVEMGREIHAAIAGSALVVIPDAGHMTFVEQPDAFYEAVSALLK